MKKLLATFALAATTSMTAFAAQFTGVIADSKCKHTDETAAHIACTEKCIKGGADAVLVTADDKVYTIDKASMAKIQDHLGHKVTVNGKLKGDTLTISSVKM